jgi:PhzF family phenazine biosynthesis protein
MTLYQIDAFTDQLFAGNPAAVALLDDWPDADRMQHVAAEMNLAETAFLVPHGGDAFGLRWFTPETEVDLCGHATLAAAHFLWNEEHLPLDETARFETKSGALSARREDDLIWMDFPAEPVRETPPLDDLTDALGTAPLFVGRNRMDVLALLPDEAAVRDLSPDLAQLGGIEARGVIVTAQADDEAAGYDFVSRFFAPSAGVPEDPVTGSAHCALAPFWTDLLGRNELTGRQVSRRGGTVRVRAEDDRVHLGGRAVAVMRAELLV